MIQINFINKVDALTQSIDQDKLEKSLKQQKHYVQDISRTISSASVAKQKNLSAHLISSTTNRKRNSIDKPEYDSFDQLKQDIGYPQTQKDKNQINILRSRVETSDEKQMRDLNKFKKVNSLFSDDTLKVNDISMKNQNQTDDKLDKNDKSINFPTNSSEQGNKTHKKQKKRSYHQILESILNEQIKIKYNGSVTSKDTNPYQRIFEKNSDTQQSLSKSNINENMRQEDQSKSHQIIRPQKVESQEQSIKKQTQPQQKGTTSQLQQSSSVLNKFMNLKVYTNGNKSLKYIQKNGYD